MSTQQTSAAAAAAVAAASHEPVTWTAETGQGLVVMMSAMNDNTSEFTRSNLRGKGPPKRYYDSKLTFVCGDSQSQFLRLNEAIIPYVPPRAPSRPSQSSAASAYGSQYAYACFPRAVLDRLLDQTAVHKYRVDSAGDAKLQSNDEDWWTTLNFAPNCQVKGQTKAGGALQSISLPRVFLASKLGVIANVVVTVKVKCAIDEARKEDGSYYDWSEESPAIPNTETVWSVATSAVALYVVDMNIDVDPPARQAAAALTAPVEFAATSADLAGDSLAGKFAALGL